MVMAPFLGGGNIYDDDGALITGLPFKFSNGIFSETAATPIGAITNMYDGNNTSYYSYCGLAAGGQGATFVKWDFKRRINFKNIYLYYYLGIAGGGGGIVMALDGSNDDSAWTEIATSTAATGTTKSGNLTATSVKYRYIRVHTNDTNAGSSEARVYSIKGEV